MADLLLAGGEAVEAVSTAASKAAEEAATGSWLQQLESGTLPRIAAPGLSQGWFGPWDSAPEDESSQNLASRQGEGLHADCPSCMHKKAVSLIVWPVTDSPSTHSRCVLHMPCIYRGSL